MMRSIFLFIFTFSSFLTAESKPNVLFILVDDLGWMDVGYQNKQLDTPNINKLAKSGMVFSDAYAATVCSPSRAAILTGRSPASLKITAHIPGVGFEPYIARKRLNTHKFYEAEMKGHLPLEEVTLAEVFKANSYKTAFFGKWHLSGAGSAKTKDGVVEEKWHPQYQGFDLNKGGCAYGQPKKSFYSPYLNAELKDGPKGEYLTDRLAEETMKFITENKENPFFAYLSFYSIHTPLIPKKEILARSPDKRTAMIYCMDEAVGKVIDKLDELQLRDNTLIVFTSDNGGTKAIPPLRGNKGQAYEGGIRVPLIYSWKNKIKSGITQATPVGCEDFFPTLIEYLNLSQLDTLPLDGQSYSTLLNNKPHQHRPLYQHFPHHRNGQIFNGSSTLRLNEWKLIWWHQLDQLELFNLKEDLGENNNLVSQFPEKASTMKKQLQTWLKHVDANFGRPNPDYSKAN